MKTEKIGTWLPIFQGFYGSSFEDDDDLLDKLFSDPEKLGETSKEWLNDNAFNHIDYSDYHLDLAKCICDTVCETMIEQKLITSYEFEELRSPKEYNFTNDSINVKFEVCIQDLVDKCMDNFEDFKQYIKDTYTSYDGFSSSYTNNATEWIEDLEDNTSHKIGSMLQFLIEFDYLDLYEACSNNVYIGEYINYDTLLGAFNEEFHSDLTEFEHIENYEAASRQEKQFLQELTGIGLYETEPEDMDISDLRDKSGLNKT